MNERDYTVNQWPSQLTHACTNNADLALMIEREKLKIHTEHFHPFKCNTLLMHTNFVTSCLAAKIKILTVYSCFEMLAQFWHSSFELLATKYMLAHAGYATAGNSCM